MARMRINGTKHLKGSENNAAEWKKAAIGNDSGLFHELIAA